jgi:thiol:disulfide interchange protein
MNESSRTILIGALCILALITATCVATVIAVRPEQTVKLTAVADDSDSTAQSLKPVKPTKLKQIDWKPTYEAAIASAKAAHKPVMIDFYTDSCGFCKKLDAETYTARVVIDQSKDFVNVKVNAEKRNDLAEKYQISEFPHIIWIDSDGNILHQALGWMAPKDFVVEMQTALSKSSSGAI